MNRLAVVPSEISFMRTVLSKTSCRISTVSGFTLITRLRMFVRGISLESWSVLRR